jgi:hypothetical protein
MGRAPKPILLHLQDKKGHFTKPEIALRKREEKNMLTGREMEASEEVKSNLVAFKEFSRIKELYALIEKDDDLYSDAINMHSMLTAECKEFQSMKKDILKELEELKLMHKSKGIDTLVYLQLKDGLNNRYMSCDKFIMTKRTLLLSIAKEAFLTPQSALRSIPKKVVKQEADPKAYLYGD